MANITANGSPTTPSAISTTTHVRIPRSNARRVASYSQQRFRWGEVVDEVQLPDIFVITRAPDELPGNVELEPFTFDTALIDSPTWWYWGIAPL